MESRLISELAAAVILTMGLVTVVYVQDRGRTDGFRIWVTYKAVPLGIVVFAVLMAILLALRLMSG